MDPQQNAGIGGFGVGGYYPIHAFTVVSVYEAGLSESVSSRYQPESVSTGWSQRVISRGVTFTSCDFPLILTDSLTD